MDFRKRDYIIFYFIIATFTIVSLMSPVKMSSIISVGFIAVFPALILGTLTNFIFKKR